MLNHVKISDMAKRLTEEVDDITRCCICTEFYTNPKVLPCVHTFCLKCLKTYTEDKDPGDNEVCPLCRQVFTIPDGGIALLPNNFLVDKLIEVKKLTSECISEQNLMCEICAESNEADPNKAAK